MNLKQRLREAIAGATPGPWAYSETSHTSYDSGTGEKLISYFRWIKGGEFLTPLASIHGTDGRWLEDGTFIALANPETLTRLLDAYEELETAVKISCMSKDLCLIAGPCRFCKALAKAREILGDEK